MAKRAGSRSGKRTIGVKPASTRAKARRGKVAKAKTAPATKRSASGQKRVSRNTVSRKKEIAPRKTASRKTGEIASRRTVENVGQPRVKGQGTPRKSVARPQTHTGPSAGAAPVPPSKPRYYLTTAIAYPNGVPHIGHAYEAIATDAIARFMRLDGHDVFFLTGTDEHGIKMLQTAAREGLTPAELVARNVPRFQAMVARLNCSNDDFIRTTEERHRRSTQAIWDRMARNGDIYLSKYSGWYSVRDEAYYDEEETRVGEGGVRLGPQGSPVEWVEEESYFFRLSAYQDKLLDLYARVPDFVLPKERLNEVASFVRRGLQDLSISRTTFEWGIPVPNQGEGERTRHIMYVWVDALTNYITARGFPDTEANRFRRYWPADLHVIGKDIVRFHAVYWPAFLLSAGIEVPRRIFSHGFLFNRGEKMSKSVGNVVDPFALADAYGVDPLRYFLLREIPFGQDGNYSHEAIVNRINADLANDLGNLAQRSLTMIARQRGGVLPSPGAFSETDNAMLAAADVMIDKAREAMKTQQLHQVLNTAWAVVADANRYFAGEAPWALAKTDPHRQSTVLYVTAEVIRQVAILAQPFIPASAARLLDLLAIPGDERSFAALGGAQRLAPGTMLPPPVAVFPRYVDPDAKGAS
ncbi:MAG: methionine--tRNA ligase [Hyphomicrobiales bacterium]|nr:methionine--tRNA ligase [Hyphomicrobiales bacterium]